MVWVLGIVKILLYAVNIKIAHVTRGKHETFLGELEAPRQSTKVAHLFSEILFLLLRLREQWAGKRLITLVICTLTDSPVRACLTPR